MEILTLKNLTFSYPEQTRRVLDDVSFSVDEGDFCVLAGGTGGGKSTLLRLCKPALAPHGTCTGEILYKGVPLDKLPARESALRIGFVCQMPDQQIVCDKVWHELVFGLENLGLPQKEISRRVAEMASYFGIEPWFDLPISALSGGQKQLLCLASVMVMRPDLLILDEPTAGLDPEGRGDLLSSIKNLHDKKGTTVILVSHSMEDVARFASHVLIMNHSKAVMYGETREIFKRVDELCEIGLEVPQISRVFAKLREKGYEVPESVLTVAEAKDAMLKLLEKGGKADA